MKDNVCFQQDNFFWCKQRRLFKYSVNTIIFFQIFLNLFYQTNFFWKLSCWASFLGWFQFPHSKSRMSVLVAEFFKVSAIISTKLVIWKINKLWVIIAQYFQKFKNLEMFFPCLYFIYLEFIRCVEQYSFFFAKVKEIMRFETIVLLTCHVLVSRIIQINSVPITIQR